MFQQGDEVTPFLNQLRAPQYEEYQLDIKLEDDGAGNFFEVKRDPEGKIVSTKPINLNLSPTQDPLEAYRTQSYNERIQALKNVGTGIVGALTTKGLGGFLGRRLGPLVPNVLKSRFSPVQLTKKPGQVISGKKGFQPQDPTKISSYNIKPKPGVIPGSLFVGGYGGLSAAQVTESDIQKEIEQLEKQKKPETQEIEKQDKQAIDPLFGGISDEEVDKVLGVSEENVDQELQDANEIDVDSLVDTTIDFQDKMLDDKNLSRLLRETGIKLVEEGRFSGIASGAASAAKLKAAEESAETLAKSQPSEFEEFLAKEKIKNTSPDKIAKQTNDLAQAVSDYEQGQVTLQMFNSVKEIMEKSDITGFGPITKSLINQVTGFFDPNVPLSPRERAVVILEQIANGNIKTITGESGRTISNVDRQIARQLVGDLKNPLTRETEVLEKINTQINSVNQRTQKALNEYKATSLFFTQNDLPVPLAPQTFAFDTTSKEGRIRLKIQ
jgi:hypothetical protein